MGSSEHELSARHRRRDLGVLRRPAFVRELDDSLIGEDGHLDETEQLRILSSLLPAQNRRSVMRFTLMVTLSVTIAVMGLAADSAALVIGAMLIAPLMTPIMTFAASVGLGLGRRAVQAAFLVVFGAVWCIVLAYILAGLLPDVTIGSELLSRTRPDVRDLVVAIAAGTAGAYATAREDLSTALPGVAVAVALVPPLAATGMLFQADRSILAEGSLLLFVTNLLAIIVCALVVLLATGVIPTIRLCLQSPRVAIATASIIVATIVVAIPLTVRSLDVASSSKQQAEVSTIVDDWLGDLSLDVVALDVSDQTVTVELVGLSEPPSAYDLAQRLKPLLGDEAQAIVRWDQRAQGTARADTPPPADPVEVATGVVEDWLSTLAAEGIELELVDVDVEGDRINISLSGPQSPPAAPELPDQIATALGGSVDVQLRFIQSFDPGLSAETPDARLERVVRAWIGARASVRLVATSIDGSTLNVDLGAEGTPLGLTTLRRVALAAVDDADRIDIRLIPLVVAPIEPDEVPPLQLD